MTANRPDSINARAQLGDGVLVALNGTRFGAKYVRAITGKPHRCVVGYLNGRINRDGKPRVVYATVSTRKVELQ